MLRHLLGQKLKQPVEDEAEAEQYKQRSHDDEGDRQRKPHELPTQRSTLGLEQINRCYQQVSQRFHVRYLRVRNLAST